MTSRWTEQDIPGQSGRIAVVTGANTGVGFQIARALAWRGAVTVLACRDPRKAADAAAQIRATPPHPSAAGSGLVEEVEVDVEETNLASLSSIHTAAKAIRDRYPRIDLLINNAGVMWQPAGRTMDGFETHLGVNHLGHFALTGLLLDRMLGTTGSRIVTVSSPAHKQGRIDFADLQSDHHYRHIAAYAQSKLANLMFAYELQRRLTTHAAATTSLAAHPGGARSELNRTMPPLFRGRHWGLALPITHSTEKGALPILRAATAPTAEPGQYYGPDGWHEFRGRPTLLASSDSSHDAQAQRRLWAESERLTGVEYSFAVGDRIAGA
ncbi:SDR family NAD(P)-dependent oxidoreductase [Catenulispora sp. NL8]|uniref:SDR family NAD(P)-dependent oxidoreductase n=1 Tax=Catenulispora pinistramenti TaxID=2705254 RepID=A0ABS5KTQ2_9ACTN|nr:oxidoreductase [Catenulispora pinistramenti]MBS2549417.1 SDR family NAD(P)-dependent oxidoreductase [Catenulispora pinistramenti]